MTDKEPVYLDTSVLINFLRINRTDLLANHPDFFFYITDHVEQEITKRYSQQLSILKKVIKKKILFVVSIHDEREILTFAKLTLGKRLGKGESAAIAAAVVRKGFVAIDDKTARREAHKMFPKLGLLDTQTLMVSLVRHGILDIEEADRIKTIWETQHRFTLKISSFRELI